MMEPWNGWGQMFTRWFKPPVLIANYAESGETAASFIGERRWPKLMSEIHAGDYVLMQFGINDRGQTAERFKGYFLQFIKDCKLHGATPILVTSQNLWHLDKNGKAFNTLVFAGRGGARGAATIADGATRPSPVDYPQAMRDVAKDQSVLLIDLNAMSMPLYEAIGPANLKRSTVDGTHATDYGSYELAKCVVQAVIDAKLPWAQLVTDDWKPFDPAHPDPIDEFKLPPDPQLDPARSGATRPSARAATR
jgi:lysophospholipase L1-like esterase